MDFFRKNQKIIVGIIAVSFVLFTLAPILFAMLSGK